MAIDYKHRSSKSGKTSKRQVAKSNRRTTVTREKSANGQKGVPLWRWGLVIILVGLFVYFLYSLFQMPVPEQPTRLTKPLARQTSTPAAKNKSVKKPVVQDDIQYDFYTLLPEAEFVIPGHEVKTRKREELVGKTKLGVQYFVQVGAFRNHMDADRLKVKLIMMGFLPKIEKAVIGSTTWYRVKMGPYNKLTSVDAIQSRLKTNKIEALVLEVKK